jgi:class 3 adenylate cyclase
MSMLTENTPREIPGTTNTEPHTEELILVVTRVIPSTQVCTALGDTRMFELLAQYYALVAREVATVDGRVIKVMGDATLLTFPAEHARTVVEGLRTLQTKANALWQQFDDRCRVQVKAGIGTVVAGMLGPPGEQRPDIIGSALNHLFKAPWGDFEVTAELTRLLE